MLYSGLSFTSHLPSWAAHVGDFMTASIWAEISPFITVGGIVASVVFSYATTKGQVAKVADEIQQLKSDQKQLEKDTVTKEVLDLRLQTLDLKVEQVLEGQKRMEQQVMLWIKPNQHPTT